MKKLTLILLVLIVLLAACGDSTSSGEAAEPTSLPQEPAPEPTESSMDSDSTDVVSLVGLWDGSLAGEHGYMAFADDGSYFVSLNQETTVSEPRVTGEYWLSDGQLHLRDLENAGHWTACDEEGVYDPAFADDGTLVFVPVEDSCNEGGFTRSFVMENTNWTYIGELP